MHRRLLVLITFLGSVLLLHVPPASAATLLVDDDGVQCRNAAYTTIQAAIAAAASGDTIEVCAGTYAEQLQFEAGQDGITLRAQTPQQAVIEPPEALINFDGVALVAVRGAQAITIEGLRLRGPIPISLCVPTPLSGIIVEGGGSATLRRTVITDIRAADPAFVAGHCSPGYGIVVRSGAPEPRTEIVLEENQVERYLTSGVQVEGAGAFATLERNQIFGRDSTTMSGRASVEVADGAGATIRANDVGDNGHRGSGLGEVPTVGIRLIGVSEVQVQGNRVSGSDHGIALSETTGSVIRASQVRDNTEYGIVVFAGSRLNTIEDNVLSNANRTPALSPTTGVISTVFPDASAAQPGAANSTLNPIDCVDYTVGDGTIGTANQWRRNAGITAIPAGICGSS
jgi:parallel beta-helix repeat protein